MTGVQTCALPIWRGQCIVTGTRTVRPSVSQIKKLLFCLLIAYKRGLLQKETDILYMSAVFHDSRRQVDWYDVGHGQRAADY